VADRTGEPGHNRAAADIPAVVARNHMAIQHVVAHNEVLAAQDRRAPHSRAAVARHLGLQHDQEMRPRPGARPRWQSQCKGIARHPLLVSPAKLNTEVSRVFRRTEVYGQEADQEPPRGFSVRLMGRGDVLRTGVPRGLGARFGVTYLAAPVRRPARFAVRLAPTR
jgi:hypothetical protein